MYFSSRVGDYKLQMEGLWSTFQHFYPFDASYQDCDSLGAESYLLHLLYAIKFSMN